MRLSFLLLVLLGIHTQIFGQKTIQLTEIPFAEKYTLSDHIEDGFLVVDLATAYQRYTGNEVIEFTGELDTLCTFDNCKRRFEDLPEDLFQKEKGFKHPVVFKIDTTTEPGEYLLRIAKGNETHLRKLTLLNYVPSIERFTVTNKKGEETESFIKYIPGQGLRDDTLRLYGEHWDKTFESVSINGKELEQLQGSTYLFGDAWESDQIRDIALHFPQLEVKRKFTDKIIEIPVTIQSGKPEVLADRSGKAVEGNTFFTLKLHVKNLFIDSRIELIHDGSFIDMDEGIYEPENNLGTNTLSFPLLLKKGVQLNRKTFQVRVNNFDGSVSDIYTIRISADEKLVSIASVDENLPLIQGEKMKVRFNRIGVSTRSFPVTGDLFFEVQGFPRQQIQPDREAHRNPRDEFSAFVDIPVGINGNSQFSIYADESYKWTGALTEVLRKPSFDTTQLSVFPGNDVKIAVNNAGAKPDELFNLTFEQEYKTVLFKDETIKGGAVVTVNKLVSASSFIVLLELNGKVIDRKEVFIEPWPGPIELIEQSTLKTNFEFTDPIVVETKRNLEPESVENLRVQVVNDNGNKLGVPLLLKERKDGRYSAIIDPEPLGLDGGEKFNLEFTNYSGEPFYSRGYRKRKKIQQFIVNAGVSAMEYRLKEPTPIIDGSDTTDISRVRLLKGINLGVYWLPESLSFNQDTRRALGFGVNLIGQQEETGVKARTALSAIIFETVVLGISFGDSSPAIFAGANISFLDMAKMFGQN